MSRVIVFVGQTQEWRKLDTRSSFGESVGPQGYLEEVVTPREDDVVIAPYDVMGTDRKSVMKTEKYLPSGLAFSDWLSSDRGYVKVIKRET